MTGDSYSFMSGTIPIGDRVLVTTDAEGRQHEEYEVVGDIREQFVKRKFYSIPLADTEGRWKIARKSLNALSTRD